MRRLVWLIDAYGAGVLLLLALRVVIGERWVVIALANTFLPFVLAPCLLLALLRLHWRRRALALLNAMPALLLLTHVLPLLLPREPVMPNEESQFQIFSYNVLAGNDREPMISDLILAANADIVLLQDVHPNAARTLETTFIGEYPHIRFHIGERRGWMSLSRLAFVDEPAFNEDTGYLRTTISVTGEPITVYNVHLASPNTPEGLDFDTRSRQLDELVADGARRSHPVVMMGDFNFNDWSEPYGRIAAYLRDAHRERGWGLGFTRDIAGEFPIARIDFAFFSAGLQAVDFQTSAASYGSDHRPIVAVFGLD
ncbi:MAG: endonuclease/exonuclease/phosphatase family protein [Chloroflexota bacterium]|nr:endonuclease/exonuclease/phosphatase family protein [Chloroflexota bacterium]